MIKWLALPAAVHDVLGSNPCPGRFQFMTKVSVAQLDAHLTGDQEVAGLIPTGPNIVSWRLIMKYFLRSFSPFS